MEKVIERIRKLLANTMAGYAAADGISLSHQVSGGAANKFLLR